MGNCIGQVAWFLRQNTVREGKKRLLGQGECID